MIELTIPNLLTALRIALIPVFSGVFFIPGWGPQASAVLFALASLTDWADGYLARRLGQSSAFGAFLDPVADKLIVCVALVLLVSRDNSLWLVAPALRDHRAGDRDFGVARMAGRHPCPLADFSVVARQVQDPAATGLAGAAAVGGARLFRPALRVRFGPAGCGGCDDAGLDGVLPVVGAAQRRLRGLRHLKPSRKVRLLFLLQSVAASGRL